jgi:hypothetical protein
MMKERNEDWVTAQNFSGHVLLRPFWDSARLGFSLTVRSRGARDVKNCTGSVNFFKALGLTPLPPSSQKRICQTEKGNF